MQFKLFDLGLIDFKSAWDFQKSVFNQVERNQIQSALILCRHKPAITIGRQGHRENILAASRDLERLNIKIYDIERGGDVTYHGPGQLCAYPIVNLRYFKKDINWFLRSLEALLLDVLSGFGVEAQALPGLTGIWVASAPTGAAGGRQEKIASIGIAIKNWITFHGLSLNIKRGDIANFSLIRPCGMDIIITALENILEDEVKIDEVKQTFIRSWHERSNFTGAGRGD